MQRRSRDPLISLSLSPLAHSPFLLSLSYREWHRSHCRNEVAAEVTVNGRHPSALPAIDLHTTARSHCLRSYTGLKSSRVNARFLVPSASATRSRSLLFSARQRGTPFSRDERACALSLLNSIIHADCSSVARFFFRCYFRLFRSRPSGLFLSLIASVPILRTW